MDKNLELVSAKYVGGYNDTTVYDAIVSYYNELVHIDIEEHYHDMQTPNKTWQLITDKNISYKERKEIIKEIIKNKPIHYSDAEPKQYNKEINIEVETKTLEGWHNSKFTMLTDYLKIGDKVDRKFLDHFINELPPKTLTGEIVQIAEAYSANKNGRATYITFATDEPFGDWYYRGACLPGSVMNEERSFEEYDMSNIEEEQEEEEIL